MRLLGAIVWTVVLNFDDYVEGYNPWDSITRASCAAINWAFPTTYVLHKGYLRNLAQANVNQKTLPFDGILDAKEELVFIVHGYLHGCKYPFANYTAEAYLKNVPGVQVVHVCWSASMSATMETMGLWGAVFYPLSTALVPCIGHSIRLFLERLHNEIGIPWGRMTMVSHSLGCQLAGSTGLQLSGKIGKQIGVDPTGSVFYWFGPFGKSSGQQVIVLHTSIFFGEWLFDRGTVDFYANDAVKQPACGFTGNPPPSEDEGPLMCSHRISIAYFNTALYHPKAFLATKCDNYDDYISGKCDGNPKAYFTPYTKATGRYYFSTKDKALYFGNASNPKGKSLWDL